MMELVCRIYAWTVAAVLSGVGWDMQAFGNVIVCGGTAVQVQPGCLAARAVGLVGLVGLAAAGVAVPRCAGRRHGDELA
jgi:hypothetical protein